MVLFRIISTASVIFITSCLTLPSEPLISVPYREGSDLAQTIRHSLVIFDERELEFPHSFYSPVLVDLPRIPDPDPVVVILPHAAYDEHIDYRIPLISHAGPVSLNVQIFSSYVVPATSELTLQSVPVATVRKEEVARTEATITEQGNEQLAEDVSEQSVSHNLLEIEQPSLSTLASDIMPTSTMASDIMPTPDILASFPQISGTIDSPVIIELPGSPWVYHSSRAGEENVELESIDFMLTKTEFRFRFSEPGNYLMSFERQNLTQGNTEVKNIPLHIAMPPNAEKQLYATEEHETHAGMAELASSAELSEVDGQNNIDISEQAILQSIAERDVKQLSLQFQLASITNISRATVINAAKLFVEQGLFDSARGLLESYILVHTNEKKLDEIIFLLAQINEYDVEGHNIHTSYELYTNLLQNYPLSPHYHQVQQRLEYIKRHYLFIR